ncbi:MAG: thiol reductant ABC exporter subunit CydC [Gulosibacter sp.]|uniref:thiol reductant ABC exporter subunit CydC n=1 Tax=Gulosibacter sp. TaxID=2817531 RepID=UPI003F91ECB2
MTRSIRAARSPIAGLGRDGKRALVVLGVVAAINATGFVLIAEALARVITAVFNQGTFEPAAIAIGVIGAVLRAAATWANRMFSARAVSARKTEIRRGLVSRILRGSDQPTGAMGTLGTRGLDDLDEYFMTFLPSMVAAIIIPLILLIRILFADWLSAVIIVLTIPLVPLFMILIGLTTRDAVDKAQDALLRMSGHLVELARGLPVLVGLGRVRDQLGALDRLSDDYRQRTMQTLKTVFMSSLAMELISTISMAVIAVFIGVRLVYGGLDLEIGLLVLILAPDCYAPFRQAGAAYHAAEDGVVALQRVTAVSEEPVAQPLWDAAEATREPAVPQTLTVRGLSVAFEGREPILEDFSFRAHAGGLTLLDGPSGAGKSTVITALAGRLGHVDAVAGADTDPDAKVVTDASAQPKVRGRVTGIDPNRLAWLPQHPHAFGETVMAELELHARLTDSRSVPEYDVESRLDGSSRIAVMRVLQEVGLLVSIADPDHTPPHALSPGELRRLAVARVLLRIDAGATTVLLDEPTAHLDPHSAELVRDAIRRRIGKATMIVASHDELVHEMCAHRVRVSGANDERSVLASMAPGHRERDRVAHTVVHRGTKPSRKDAKTDAMADELRRGRKPRATPRSLLRLLRPAGWSFVLGILIAVGAVIFGVTQTSISGWLIVRAAEQPPILLLMVAIVGVRFFGIGRSLLRYLERLQVHDAVFRLAGRLRRQLWTTLASTALRFKRLRTGPAALDLLVREVDAIRDEVPRVLVPPIVASISVVAALVAAAIWLPEAIAPLFALGIVALVLAPALVRVADNRATREEERVRSRLSQRFIALLEAGRDLQVHRVETEPLRELADLEAEAMRFTRRAAWAQGAANALVVGATIAAALWLTASLGLLAQDASGAGIDAKLLAAFALGMLALAEPLSDGVTAVQRWPRLRSLLDSVDGVLGIEATEAEATEAEPNKQDAGIKQSRSESAELASTTPQLAPALELRGVHAGWPEQESPVFEDLTVTLERGDWLTVTGPSGSGKSTLLATMMGHLPVLAGDVRVSGVPVRADAANRIAWCPQESHLFNSTLRGNLILARPADNIPTDFELELTLERVGLGPLLDSLDAGLDTPIGADGSWLSGGQRQRVAVARTLLTNAPVVLLDEPTAHLDEQGAEDLLRDLRSALANRAVVCVTHRVGELAASDRHLQLSPSTVRESV